VNQKTPIIRICTIPSTQLDKFYRFEQRAAMLELLVRFAGLRGALGILNLPNGANYTHFMLSVEKL
jgi:hypothetical protein